MIRGQTHRRPLKEEFITLSFKRREHAIHGVNQMAGVRGNYGQKPTLSFPRVVRTVRYEHIPVCFHLSLSHLRVGIMTATSLYPWDVTEKALNIIR